jgi:dihydrofolate reductase
MIKNELTIIAAASTNNVIGLDNKLIWKKKGSGEG